MPALYGKPFKSKLYTDVRKLGHDLQVEKTEHRETRRKLLYAQSKIAELEARLHQIVGIATQDVREATVQRFLDTDKKRREAAWATAEILVSSRA